MQIELTQIIMALLGGTTVGGIIEAVRYWRENRRLKESEVADHETATQSAQIDLADKYFNGMLELLEKVKQSQDKGEQSQTQILERLTAVDDRLDKVERYLNGPFHKWQQHRERNRNQKDNAAP